MQTLRAFATQLNLIPTIERAMSYHHKLESCPESVWGIPVSYSGQMKTSAGYFHGKPRIAGQPVQGAITLHPALANLSQELKETLLHELAHAFTWIVYGHVDHSATWWEMMHQLGQKPRRTHAIAACKAASPVTSKSIEELGL